MDKRLWGISLFAIIVVAVLILTLEMQTLSQSDEQLPLNPSPSLSLLEQNRTLFMQGIFYFERGEYEKAWQYFETLKGRYKELEEYVLHYLGQTLYQLEKYEEALSIFQEVIKSYPGTPLLPEVKQAAAEVLLQKQRYGEAAEVLGELLKASVQDKGEIYYKLGQALEGTENWKEALETYQQFVIYHPSHNRAAEAEKRLNWILREKGLPKPALTEQMLYEGAKALFNIRAYPKALDLYQTLIAQYPQSPWVIEASFGMAEAYRRSGKKAESAKLLTHIRASYKDENIVARALYELGNLHSHKQTLLKVLSEYPQSTWADKALYLLGQLSEKERKLTEAASWYSKILEQYPNSTLAEEASWRSGWNYYQIGEYQRAEAQFEKVIQIFWNYKDEALYWKGRSAEKQRKVEEAIKSYHKLVSEHEESYYAVLAEMRLNMLRQRAGNRQQETRRNDQQPGEDVSPRVQILSVSSEEALDLFTTNKWLTLMNSLKGKVDQETFDRASARLPKALELNQVNLTASAVKELQYILEGFNPQTPSQEDLLFKYLISHSYYESRDYLTCIRLVVQIEESLRQLQITNFPYKIQKLKYPLAYWKEIQKHAERNQLDPFLVAGLIRQESAYNVKALSTSNAMGLMQIIPPTGKYIAEKISFKGFTPDLLYEPELNITFGTWYLSYLVDQFDGNLFKAVAGYNAGPGAIGRWWKEFNHLDSDEVVENIPFRETRNYVKQVLRNWAVYRRIYGDTTKSESRLPR